MCESSLSIAFHITAPSQNVAPSPPFHLLSPPIILLPQSLDSGYHSVSNGNDILSASNCANPSDNSKSHRSSVSGSKLSSIGTVPAAEESSSSFSRYVRFKSVLYRSRSSLPLSAPITGDPSLCRFGSVALRVVLCWDRLELRCFDGLEILEILESSRMSVISGCCGPLRWSGSRASSESLSYSLSSSNSNRS